MTCTTKKNLTIKTILPVAAIVVAALAVAGCRSQRDGFCSVSESPALFAPGSGWTLDDFISDVSTGVSFTDESWISHDTIDGWQCEHPGGGRLVFWPEEDTAEGECFEGVSIRAGQTDHTTWFDKPENVTAFWREVCEPAQTNIAIRSTRSLATEEGRIAEITYFSTPDEDGWGEDFTIVGALALIRHEDFTHFHAVAGNTSAWEWDKLFGKPSDILSVFHRLVYGYSFAWRKDIHISY